MLYLRQSTRGAHNPWGGYSFTWCDTELTVTGRTPSGRLPLHRVHTIHEEAAPCYEDILDSQLQGAHPQAGYHLGTHNPWGGCSLLWGYVLQPMDIGCSTLRQATTWVHTIHEVAAPQYYMGVDPGVRPVLWISRDEFLPSQQTNDQRPWAQAHYCLYRDLSLTDDWLICLSCDHTWCCHPVVGNIPFAP